MQLVKTHKIAPIHCRPGDSINLHYSFEEPAGEWHARRLLLDTFEEPTVIDTVLVFRTTDGEYGLKGGRALIIGEDDGTYASLPTTQGYTPLIGGRKKK
jgi:hypothetical protein